MRYPRFRLWPLLLLVVAVGVSSAQESAPVALRLVEEATPRAAWPGPAPAALSTTSPPRLLVRLATPESAAAPTVDAKQRLRSYAEGLGGRVLRESRLLPATVVLEGVATEKIAELEAMPEVASVRRDYPVRGFLHQAVPRLGALQSQLSSAGYDVSGDGVRICIVDTGVDTDHLLLGGSIDMAASVDLVTGGGSIEDMNGHGSHVAGIAASNGNGTLDLGCGPLPFQGVAPDATVIAVRALDDNNQGLASDVIAALDHCVDPTLPGGPANVINLSLGGGGFAGDCDGDPLAAAANSAVAAGAVVVAAAGNDALNGFLAIPACASEVMAVGATFDEPLPNCETSATSITLCLERNSLGQCIFSCSNVSPLADTPGCFSNRGSELDVVAPGCVIHSVDISPDRISVISSCGTSMAAPHVAGLAALLLEASPGATPTEVRNAIQNGAVDLGARGVDTTYGHGRIDAVRSLELIGTPCTPDGDSDGQQACEGDCDDGNPDVYRFAEELCDVLDNDCDGEVDEGLDPDQDMSGCPDNCPLTANPGQEDYDGDGQGDACEVGASLADIDLSARVDGFDLGQLGRSFGQRCIDPGYDAAADLDRNTTTCTIDGEDLALFAPFFGLGVTP